MTGVALLAVLLSGCGTSTTEAAYETCNAEYDKAREAGEAAVGSRVLELADDGETILISGSGQHLRSAIDVFTCIADETGAPDSLIQKVENTSALDGRQSDEFDGMEVSWSYSAGDDGSFDVVFESGN